MVLRSGSSTGGWTATDNVVGDPLLPLMGGGADHVRVSDSALLRDPWPASRPGAAPGSEGAIVHLRHVDFDTDNHTPLDIAGCPTDLGLPTGVIRSPGCCPR